MRPAEISARSGVIRLKPSELSQLAGITLRSTREIFAGERPGARMTTVEALEAALVGEELRLLRHLYAIHGQAAAEAQPPAAEKTSDPEGFSEVPAGSAAR
jgi:hypothetical protein